MSLYGYTHITLNILIGVLESKEIFSNAFLAQNHAQSWQAVSKTISLYAMEIFHVESVAAANKQEIRETAMIFILKLTHDCKHSLIPKAFYITVSLLCCL
ncbi:hypothetical protein ACJX0J_034293 [Zea mays]